MTFSILCIFLEQPNLKAISITKDQTTCVLTQEIPACVITNQREINHQIYLLLHQGGKFYSY